MSQPKTARAYSTYYIELAERMNVDPKYRLSIPYGDVKKATRERQSFYTYRRKAMEEGMAEFLPVLPAIVATIDSAGNLVFTHCDYSPEKMLARQAMEQADKDAAERRQQSAQAAIAVNQGKGGEA